MKNNETREEQKKRWENMVRLERRKKETHYYVECIPGLRRSEALAQWEGGKRIDNTGQAKVHWNDLPADARIIDKGSYYEHEGRLVYWNGHEAGNAIFWLNTHLSSKP